MRLVPKPICICMRLIRDNGANYPNRWSLLSAEFHAHARPQIVHDTTRVPPKSFSNSRKGTNSRDEEWEGDPSVVLESDSPAAVEPPSPLPSTCSVTPPVLSSP